jgi:hypothetical protein
MLLHLALIPAIASGVSSRVLSVSAATANDAHMGPYINWPTERPVTPPHENTLRHVVRRINFKRDGSVTGFFDEDYANDADWKKFSNKGGALVR